MESSKTVFRAVALSGLLYGCAVFCSEPLDFSVTTTAGKEVLLSALVQGPLVVFYEDEAGANENLALKAALQRFQSHVVAVAKVAGLDWFPARGAVVRAVHDVEQRSGVSIYLDWRGAVGRAWGLADRGSSVLVLDRHGSKLFAQNGPLSRDEVAEVVSLLTRLCPSVVIPSC